jgi:hypothetical protein
MKYRTFFAAFFAVAAVIGCSGEQRPDGLPKLYPCTITITQDGQPLAGATVILYDPAVTDRWTVSGLTNTSGTAVMRTHGQFPGVPEGRFKVVLSKTETEGKGWDDPDSPKRTWENIKVYSFVAKEYGKHETTPLEIVVDGKKRSESFDIGRAERILIETIRQGDM